MESKNTNWWEDAYTASFHELTWEQQKKGKENMERIKYSGEERNLHAMQRRLSKVTADNKS
jgi:hypothetical protein